MQDWNWKNGYEVALWNANFRKLGGTGGTRASKMASIVTEISFVMEISPRIDYCVSMSPLRLLSMTNCSRCTSW